MWSILVLSIYKKKCSVWFGLSKLGRKRVGGEFSQMNETCGNPSPGAVLKGPKSNRCFASIVAERELHETKFFLSTTKIEYQLMLSGMLR